MPKDLNLPLIFQSIATTIMLLGVMFSVINIRNFYKGRKREAAILMLNSFQTNEFVSGLMVIFGLPSTADRDTIENLPKDQFLAIFIVIGAWERLGILVYRHEIDLELVDDAFSGPIIQSWEKLERYITDFRRHMQRDTSMEWFQWLAERMMDREAGAQPVPAYIAHRNWKPKA